jgi:hypothetical protein
MAGSGDIMAQRRSRRRLPVAFLLVTTRIVAAPTPAAALCLLPMEVASAAPEVAANHRYVWFLIESLAHARIGWQGADSAADSQNPAIQLADLKFAVEDFQCAASLVQTFQSGRGPDEHTTKAIQVNALAATAAYTTFATGFQRWATDRANGEGVPLEAAADLKVQNEKAGELLIHAAVSVWFAFLKLQPDSNTPMDRLTLTRAHRAALLEGLKRRSFRSEPDIHSPDTHTPDLAAAVLYKGLSSPKYKAADEP